MPTNGSIIPKNANTIILVLPNAKVKQNVPIVPIETNKISSFLILKLIFTISIFVAFKKNISKLMPKTLNSKTLQNKSAPN